MDVKTGHPKWRSSREDGRGGGVQNRVQGSQEELLDYGAEGQRFRSFPRPFPPQRMIKGDSRSAQEGRQENWGRQETSTNRFPDTGGKAPTSPRGRLR